MSSATSTTMWGGLSLVALMLAVTAVVTTSRREEMEMTGMIVLVVGSRGLPTTPSFFFEYFQNVKGKRYYRFSP